MRKFAIISCASKPGSSKVMYFCYIIDNLLIVDTNQRYKKCSKEFSGIPISNIFFRFFFVSCSDRANWFECVSNRRCCLTLAFTLHDTSTTRRADEDNNLDRKTSRRRSWMENNPSEIKDERKKKIERHVTNSANSWKFAVEFIFDPNIFCLVRFRFDLFLFLSTCFYFFYAWTNSFNRQRGERSAVKPELCRVRDLVYSSLFSSNTFPSVDFYCALVIDNQSPENIIQFSPPLRMSSLVFAKFWKPNTIARQSNLFLFVFCINQFARLLSRPTII